MAERGTQKKAFLGQRGGCGGEGRGVVRGDRGALVAWLVGLT